ncbi:acyl-CoA dehydrogenase family protein [Novosphingobium sp. SG720]|uniref:acyl-CoA dehydrogenase family protein n=1 Tax=Novosphingobium sp. SG720 TaxID=2586998 RepID=UPI0014451612|nr:acyl-CoA dehydrogenase family protein [Novosphingobium sp. SG720]NKJ40628.1 alkylation response protein AidB-like acyl-CoA dehydrogenase [Novosphingobium sp. SG720]
MDFNYTPEESAFRAELRAWLADALPKGWGETVFEPEDEHERAMFRLDWERKLHAGGWSGINWPKEYGGRGATLIERGIFAEEMARASAPEGINIIGHNLAGPTILAHGTQAQKQRFLPPIISSDEIWCQGFSEPNAGSDLASVRTRAELVGDKFIVNGQKIWTSYAQYAQWCFALVRTDPDAPKHKGLSFLLIDMSSPGITIRPLRQISGESEFNETFFDNVEVPVENVVGAVNEGWKIAMTTLAYERGPEDALGRQVRFKQELGKLVSTLCQTMQGGRAAIDNPAIRQRLARAITEIEIVRLNALRSFSHYLDGADRGADASMTKLYWSHAAQRMYDLAMDALGPVAPISGNDPSALALGRFQLSWLQSKAFTIYSGSSEIQRNIIGERVLGLPR